ncbi:MAG: hypothetical protein ACE5K8_08725, partial [Candidatus Zixiibacteriota bacterium]
MVNNDYKTVSEKALALEELVEQLLSATEQQAIQQFVNTHEVEPDFSKSPECSCNVTSPNGSCNVTCDPDQTPLCYCTQEGFPVCRCKVIGSSTLTNWGLII